MIPTGPPDRALVAELVAVLDEEIALLIKKQSELAALADSIVERDDERLAGLLVEMQQTQQAQSATDVKLDALRNIFAERLLCRPEELKLSRIIESLDEDDRLTVDYRRQQIVVLGEQLRREHLETAILLAESARINRLLLEGLFPQSRPVTTYDIDGQKSWRPGAGLLNTEL